MQKDKKESNVEKLKQLKKAKREKMRREALEKKNEEQKHLSSYLNKEQFTFFNESL